jgi:hypothetical protein
MLLRSKESRGIEIKAKLMRELGKSNAVERGNTLYILSRLPPLEDAE